MNLSQKNKILGDINELATAYHVADLLIQRLGVRATLNQSKTELHRQLGVTKGELAGQGIDDKIKIKEEQGEAAANKISNSLQGLPGSIQHVTSVVWIGRMGKKELEDFFKTLGDNFNGNPSDFVIIFARPVNTGLRDNNGEEVLKIWIGYSLKATFSKNGSIGAYNGSICKLIEGVINLQDNIVLDKACPPGGKEPGGGDSQTPGSIVQREIVGIWNNFLYNDDNSEIGWTQGQDSQTTKVKQQLYKNAKNNKAAFNSFNKKKLQCFDKCRDKIFQSFLADKVPMGKFVSCEISDDETQLKFTLSKSNALIPINAYLRINGGSEASYYKVEAYNKSNRGVYRIEMYQPNPLLYLPANYIGLPDDAQITFIVTKPSNKKDSVCTLNLCCPALDNGQQAAEMSIDFRIKAADTPPSGLKMNGCDHKCKKTKNVYMMKTYPNYNAGAALREEAKDGDRARAADAADVIDNNDINDYFIFVQEAILNYIEDQDKPLEALDQISNSLELLFDVLQNYVDLLHLPSQHTRAERLAIRNLRKGDNLEIIQEVIDNIKESYPIDEDDSVIDLTGQDEVDLTGLDEDQEVEAQRSRHRRRQRRRRRQQRRQQQQRPVPAVAPPSEVFNLISDSEDEAMDVVSEEKVGQGIKKHTHHKGKHHKGTRRKHHKGTRHKGKHHKKKHTRHKDKHHKGTRRKHHKGKHHKGKHHKGTRRRNKRKNKK